MMDTLLGHAAVETHHQPVERKQESLFPAIFLASCAFPDREAPPTGIARRFPSAIDNPWDSSADSTHRAGITAGFHNRRLHRL